MTRQRDLTGRAWLRKDGRWSARAYPPDGGKPRMVYGRSEAEALAKQHQAENGGTVVRQNTSATRPAGGKMPRQNAEPARTKPVRITIDLDGERYTRLQRWVATAAIAANPDRPRFSQAAAIRAMIDAATADESIGLVVTGLLRRDQETGP